MVALSAFAIHFFNPAPVLYRIHIGFGGAFVLLAAIHIIHRRGKWLKLITQCRDVIWRNQAPSYCNLDRLLMSFESHSLSSLCVQFQLPFPQVQEALKRARIVLTDVDKPLRENVKSNDEMLFSIITLLLKLKLNPEHI